MDKTVGILGGGQLGRMLTESANRLNIRVVSLDAQGAPAKQINANVVHPDGSFKDPDDVRKLAAQCDVLTIEIEHVNASVLEELEADVEIHPSWKTIKVIQDKFLQKEHLNRCDIGTCTSKPVQHNTIADLHVVAKELQFPFMLKSRTEAYDGRGNFRVNSKSDFQNALDVLRHRPLYAEAWAPFKMELAVMVAKTENNPSSDWATVTKAFPVVETLHENNICKLVYAPARRIPERTLRGARELAQKAVASFWGKGVFGVEMFLLKDESLVVNEIAPRPHNSGHYSIEACPLSQYDAHLRSILDLPVRTSSLQMIGNSTTAIMLNILGGETPNSHMQAARAALNVDGARIHLYGKGDARLGRKMGHITVVAGDMPTAEARMAPLVTKVDQMRATRQIVDESVTERRSDLGQSTKKDSSVNPLVAVTMGSESDRSVLAPGIKLLAELDIPYTATITSAHRTPERMVSFAKEARSRGIKVIIAAAGGAAHLPGMIAACTSVPVIGVPVRASVLDGLDSLLSIVQMPRGCPVATVAINNSINAAQLSARILANEDQNIRSKLERYIANQTSSVEGQAQRMETFGFDGYDNAC